ncbi:MAG: WG repeat-containing protein, partial [Holophagaceae bacterium]
MMANDWQSKYFYVWPFKEGLAGVNVGGKYLKIGEDEDLGSSLGLVEGGQWGFVDETGKEVIPPKYDWVDYFHNGFARVNVGGEYVQSEEDEDLGWNVGLPE